METSQVAPRCILSALLFFVLVWFFFVLDKCVRAASESRWRPFLLLISCALSGICDLVLIILSEVQFREDGISLLLRCSSACIISYQVPGLCLASSHAGADRRQSIPLWHCLQGSSSDSHPTRVWWRSIGYLFLLGGIIVPLLLEMAIFIWCASKHSTGELSFADFKNWLRNSPTCFRVFFITSLIEYVVLGSGWFVVLLSSQDHRWLLMGTCLSSFIIAASAIGVLVVGISLGRLQILLFEVQDSRFHIERAWLTRYRCLYY